ncbi:MAG: hypothetical protein DRN04_08845 [Thermoprotei archaeon]|nr:MAG: hypothetical protein DRN04_08845 [Thermoprotei archaeon]
MPVPHFSYNYINFKHTPVSEKQHISTHRKLNNEKIFIPLFYISAKKNPAKKLIELLIEFGSFFAIKPSSIKIDHIDILGGYILDFDIYKKALIFNIKKEKDKKGKSEGWGKLRIMKTLKYLSEINTLSPFSARIYFTIEKPIQEAWSPSYIKFIHENLKKSTFSCDIELFTYYAKKLEKLGLYVENPDGYMSALSIVAWGTGAHRHGMALKQIAAQELLESIILNQEKASHALVFLSALIVDTYAWLPYILGRKEVALTSELQYAIAATPLRELEEATRNLSQVVPSLRNKVYIRLRKELNHIHIPQNINEFCKYLKQLEQAIRESIKDHYSKDIKREVLIGRLNILSQEIAKKMKKEKIKKILITLTEQTAPILMEIIQLEATDIEETTIIYTPQTLYNRLLFAEKLGNIKKVHYIPVSSIEPAITEEILKKNMRNRYDLAIIQGSLTIALSVLDNLHDRIDSSKIIFV